jgi:hypothetical protein
MCRDLPQSRDARSVYRVCAHAPHPARFTTARKLTTWPLTQILLRHGQEFSAHLRTRLQSQHTLMQRPAPLPLIHLLPRCLDGILTSIVPHVILDSIRRYVKPIRDRKASGKPKTRERLRPRPRKPRRGDNVPPQPLLTPGENFEKLYSLKG